MRKKLWNSVKTIVFLAALFLLSVSTVNAADTKAGGKSVVYTKYKDGNTNNYFGDGTKTNPYNQFRDAVDNVADGGTIYIIDQGFLNEKEGEGGRPLIINKNITIKSASETVYAKLSTRSTGILLGADVRFENIQLHYENRKYDSIFANGHKLELINVSSSKGGRQIDLFAGGLNSESSGTGQIIMKRDANFNDSENRDIRFGNIYAGSMNSPFRGSAVIDIDGNGKIKYGHIYASGAHESDPGDNWFDQTELEPPRADAQSYPTAGNVEIRVNKPDPSSEIHGEGAKGEVTVSFSTEYPIEPVMTEIDNLVMANGEIYGKNIEKLTGNLKLGEKAILNLTEHPASVFRVDGNFQSEGGIVRLKRDGTIDVGGTISGRCRLQTKDHPTQGDESGPVKEKQVYFSAASKSDDAQILFTPYSATQKDWKLYVEKTADKVVWKAGKPSDGSATLTSLKIVPAEQTMTVKEFWENNAEFELQYEGSEAALDNLEHQINGGLPEASGMDLFNFSATLYVQQSGDMEGYNAPGVYTLTVSHPESGITSSAKLILEADWKPEPPIEPEPEPEPPIDPNPPIDPEPEKPPVDPKPPVEPEKPPVDPKPPVEPEKPPVDPKPPVEPEKPPVDPKPPVTPPTVPQKVTGVKLNHSSISIPSGGTAVLKPQVTPSNAANKKLNWNSSNSTVAVVNQNGTVTAKTPGTAVITAKSADGSGKYAQCKVTVGYKVTYYLNGGKNHSSNKGVYYGKSVSLGSPSRKGYSFGGWYTDKNYRKKIQTISGNTTKNYTVYAKWQKVKTGKTAFTSVKSSKRGQIAAKYKKVSGAKGYEITYSTHKKFKKSATKSVKSKSVRYTVKKLKRGKTYYVKVRAYKTDSTGQNVYGSYSKVKKIKVKK